MNEFQLQNEMTDATRREVDLYLERRNLQMEVQFQKQSIKKKYDKFLASLGLLTLVFAMISFVFNGPFDFFLFFLFGALSVIDLIWMFFILNRKRQDLEIWEESPYEFAENKW